MGDAQQQLATLLGREVKQLRITEDDPPYISVVDVAAVITGKNHDAAACPRGTPTSVQNALT